MSYALKSRLKYGAFAFSLSFVAACGAEAEFDLAEFSQQEQAIINGQPCAEDEEQTTVAILMDAEISAFGNTIPIKSVTCTGTLIAPDVVMAAAHCIDENVLLQQFFGYGEINRITYSISRQADLSYLIEAAAEQGGEPVDFPEDAISVLRYVKNADFDINNFGDISQNPGPGLYSDVGLLFLSESIIDVAPAVVVTAAEAEQVVEQANVKIVGWGQQTPAAPGKTNPPKTLGIKVCAEAFINEVGEAEFQVGGDITTARKCRGDSGGPTFMQVETDRTRTRRVIGITSHSYDQEDCKKGGVDTRVSFYLEWINDEMVNACEDGTRNWCDVPGLIQPEFYDPPPEEAPATDTPALDEKNEEEGCSATSTSNQGFPLSALFFGLLALMRRSKNKR